MSDLDRQLVATLDRLYPPNSSAADWAEVLERVERLRERQHEGQARRPDRVRSWLLSRRVGMVVAVAAVALVASLAVTAPWRGGPSFIAKALAAIGSDRYVIATVEPAGPSATDVDLATSRKRPVRLTVSYWLDSKRIEYHSRTYLDGVPVSSQTAGPDPALAAFAKGYRAALANGAATVVGQTTVAGRKARIIRFKLTSLYLNGEQIQFPGGQPTEWEDVAVDASTYKPLWFREGGLTQGGTAREGPPSRVVAIRAVASSPRIPKNVPFYQGTATTLRQLTPTETRGALGYQALWPGARLDGLPLRSALLQRVTTSLYPVVYPPLRNARGLHLVYQHRSARLEIREAATPLGGYGFASTTRTAGLGAIPPEGTIRISRSSAAFTGPFVISPAAPTVATPWVGQLRRNGLYLTIRASSRQLLLAAARALAPMK